MTIYVENYVSDRLNEHAINKKFLHTWTWTLVQAWPLRYGYYVQKTAPKAHFLYKLVYLTVMHNM